MPYEENLEDVTCPKEFVEAWRQVWGERMDANKDAQYISLKRILRYDENINTVPNTLYRFFVMLGLPNLVSNGGESNTGDNILSYDYKENPILATVKKIFKLTYKRSSGSSKKAKKKIIRANKKLYKSLPGIN